MAWHRAIVLGTSLLACTAPASVSVPAPVTRTEPAVGIVGTWLGYADGLKLDSKSDRVQLIVTSHGPGNQITGTVAFGEPGSFTPLHESEVADSDDGGIETALEHFSYTLDGTYDASLQRLEVAFASTEVWADWCTKQSSYVGRNGRHACLPDCQFTKGPDRCELIDCPARPGKFECGHRHLCGQARVCECDASSCRNNAKRQIALDLHHDGDDLEGKADTMGNIFLKRR